MNKLLSRQAKWQAKNPERQRLIRQQVALNKRKQLLDAGYVKTHEEICEFIEGYEKRNGKITDEVWWLAYEYLDWKYNKGKITAPTPQEKET